MVSVGPGENRLLGNFKISSKHHLKTTHSDIEEENHSQNLSNNNHIYKGKSLVNLAHDLGTEPLSDSVMEQYNGRE